MVNMLSLINEVNDAEPG